MYNRWVPCSYLYHHYILHFHCYMLFAFFAFRWIVPEQNFWNLYRVKTLLIYTLTLLAKDTSKVKPMQINHSESGSVNLYIVKVTINTYWWVPLIYTPWDWTECLSTITSLAISNWLPWPATVHYIWMLIKAYWIIVSSVTRNCVDTTSQLQLTVLAHPSGISPIWLHVSLPPVPPCGKLPSATTPWEQGAQSRTRSHRLVATTSSNRMRVSLGSAPLNPPYPSSMIPACRTGWWQRCLC